MLPRVFGASLGRTGTQTLTVALQELGLRTYGMRQIIKSPAEQRLWHHALTSKIRPDWQALFADYDATIGWPMCFFTKEFLAAVPEAKFLLSTRDPASWFESLDSAWTTLSRLRSIRFIPRVRGVLSVVEPVMERLGGIPPNRKLAIEAYEAHRAMVRTVVPAERLLEFHISQGWEPLCQFLDLPFPDKQFPHVNAKSDGLRGVVVKLLQTSGEK